MANVSIRTDPVVIHDYDPNWPQLFDELRLRIATVLEGTGAEIEHIGSTAVAGLAAKPIIDIDVLLRSRAHLPLVILKLASLGYQHGGDLGVPGREAFRIPPHDPPHHLYVCPPGNLEYRRHIAFRDHLRTIPGMPIPTPHSNASWPQRSVMIAKLTIRLKAIS